MLRDTLDVKKLIMKEASINTLRNVLLKPYQIKLITGIEVDSVDTKTTPTGREIEHQ